MHVRATTNNWPSSLPRLLPLLHPLAGVTQSFSSFLQGRGGPHVFILGGELTGVHRIADLPDPKSAAVYHLGAGGRTLSEALVKALAESVERYCQFAAAKFKRTQVRVCPESEIENPVRANYTDFFLASQYDAPSFPFEKWSPSMPMGWIDGYSINRDAKVSVHAQAALTGYAASSDLGEKRVIHGTTTGGAAHVSRGQAAENAILELIQIDTAMGQWYGSERAVKIEFDQRLACVDRLLRNVTHDGGPSRSFFWLKNPDYPIHTVCCLLREQEGELPANALGLGTDFSLDRAIYKAYLEAVGVFGMTTLNLLDLIADEKTNQWKRWNPDSGAFLDLDANVAYYALSSNSSKIAAKFNDRSAVRASDLPPDLDRAASGGDWLIDQFRKNEHELVVLDLTTSDIDQTGLKVIKAVAPELLPLSLPGAPMLAHPRLLRYGGLQNKNLHPYA